MLTTAVVNRKVVSHTEWLAARKAFLKKEKEFKLARANYVYRQDIRVQTLNANDRMTGEWHQVWDVTFDSNGRRTERVISARNAQWRAVLRAKVGQKFSRRSPAHKEKAPH